MNHSSRSVVVALSGGVDSAMAAALLIRSGWTVHGLHFLLPAAASRIKDRIAAVEGIVGRLNMPLEMLDLEQAFDRAVIAPFLNAYLQGLTPNPCVMCNETVKFKYLEKYAQDKGIDAVATGHYVIISRENERAPTRLFRGKDPVKEQSYFLHRLDRSVLSKTVFPLGEWTKADVRKQAKEIGLPVHAASGSQEICFIPGNDYRRFMGKRDDARLPGPGLIVTEGGERVGEHGGIHAYTIGQRHGLGIASERPYYVKEIRPESNELVVARKEALFSGQVAAGDVNWIEGMPEREEMPVSAQVRYRHRAARGRLRVVSPLEVTVDFRDPQWAVTPGQALVFYEGNRLLGGGWIRRDGKSIED
ncbi:MAG: tRNA 2-thiouridine(34) synthase MnmA [Deltaproteobacteria bacterium]|nr:tRNA 2-thiouridine(34) synthase MnmA [Deltaproteobacteria bacterium]